MLPSKTHGSQGVRPLREAECASAMELFIEAVRLHPCLWNPHHPDYRDFGIKDDAWQQVVEEFGNKKYISNSKFCPNIMVCDLVKMS